MSTKRLVAPIVVLAALLLLAALPADAQPRPSAYILPGEDVFPEGVTFDEQTQTFYVSSTTDGAIFRGTPSEEAAEVFLPGGEDGRTSATGLDVDAGRLFVSGGGTGKMFVYDSATGDLLAALSTSR